MARRAKIAISLDPEVLGAVERLRAQKGESRSAVISRAISQFTKAATRAAQVELYVRAYRELPENDADVRAARQHAKQLLIGLPWEGDE